MNRTLVGVVAGLLLLSACIEDPIPPGFFLTIVRAGTGTGTVTSSPAGLSCGMICEAELAEGSLLTLTATPAVGSTFAGWSGGGCTGTGVCALTMTANTTVTATFN